ncbi:hypothetical protein BC832DRAFT_215258 [Gaertneriomyces semiglobifer]|nr:hypothetical protein BC832DRAFT_215258 [Gaertneriomyces semiglobifer]
MLPILHQLTFALEAAMLGKMLPDANEELLPELLNMVGLCNAFCNSRHHQAHFAPQKERVRDDMARALRQDEAAGSPTTGDIDELKHLVQEVHFVLSFVHPLGADGLNMLSSYVVRIRKTYHISCTIYDSRRTHSSHFETSVLVLRCLLLIQLYVRTPCISGRRIWTHDY